MISVKSSDDITKMRRAGAVVADVLKLMNELVRPGIDTMSLDEAAADLLERESAVAAFKGYRVRGIAVPFPGSICASVNDEVVHGIPSRERVLAEGDILSVDVGAVIDGFYGDAARTFAVGGINAESKRLLDITKEALDRGIAAAEPHATLGDVGHAIEQWVLSNGFGLVRDYAGHGIGRKLHEAPQVPNYGKPRSGVTLRAGMTFCIEPMVMSGAEAVVSVGEGWTVVTADGSRAAHFEHTVHVTPDGVEILTPWE